MNTLIKAVIERKKAAVLAFLIVFVAGIVSLNSIPKESTPDMTLPMVYVSIRHEGISPEDADRLLFEPMYKELRGLEGLKEIISTAVESHLSIQLEFESDMDIDQALRDVREAVDMAKAELPPDSDEPIVQEINLSLFPILVVGVSGNIDERILLSVARRLRDRIEALPGVLEAEIQGNRDEVAEIIVDPNRMDSFRLNQSELVQLVGRNNQLVAAGNLDTGAGRFALKVPGLIESIPDILHMPIKVRDAQVVRFKDIANGQRTFKDALSLARINGKPALAIEVKKRLGANIIDTVNQVKIIIEQATPELPKGISLTLSQDQSESVQQLLNDLSNNVAFSAIIVLILVIASLGVRSALLVGMAIPGSFLLSVLSLQLMGYTLNMVVLFSLILSVGMLVDGAIVVTELADRRLAEGKSRATAYYEAATRMAWPVIASTITTLAVFLPLIVWPGLTGEFMKFLPITVLLALSSSLIMALILVPTFGAIFGKAGDNSTDTIRELQAAETGDLNHLSGFTGRYIQLLSLLLKHPVRVLLGTCLTLVLSFVIYGFFGKGVEFFPEVDADYGVVDIRGRGNLSLAERDQLVRLVEANVANMDEVKTLYAKVFVEPPRDGAKDVIGRLQLELVDWQHRRTAKAILTEIEQRSAALHGILVSTHQQAQGPGGGDDIQLDVLGVEAEPLQQAVKQVMAFLAKDAQIKDLNDTLPLEGIEWQLEVDREAASRLGADIATTGRTIQMITSGLTLGSYRPEDADDEVDIRLRFPEQYRTLEHLDQLQLTVNGALVPASSFMTRIAKQKSSEVVRSNGKRRFQISANLQEGVNPTKKIQQINQWLQQQSWQEGVEFVFRGDLEEQQEASVFLSTAFLFAVLMMVLILVIQFDSYYHTALIMSAIVLSTAGVLIGLMLNGESFGIVMNGVSLIALAGIVVNNNIVLIDTFQSLRRQGMDKVEAALRTGAQRLRPVMLTTVTTIFGLMPMVFQWTIDIPNRAFSVGAPSAQWWTQLATAIAGGLTFAAFLTLILTPCLLVLGHYRPSQTFTHQRPSQAIGHHVASQPLDSCAIKAQLES
jgi:multidrug efflux pump